MLRTVRRLCAAIDAVAATFIAANLSRSLASSASPSTPDNFPSISKAAAALANSRRAPDPPPAAADPSSPALVRIKAERDPEALVALFEANATNTVVVENRFAFEDTVSRLAGARRRDLVSRLLEHQKTFPQGRREGFLVRVISLYGRAAMPDHALSTFHSIPLTCRNRTAKSFNATLKVLAQCHRYEEVQILFADATSKYQITLDEISYNTVIKALCEMGRLDSAYLVMVEMEKSGVKPDVVTYTTLLSAAYKAGRREIGDGLWNLMTVRGVSPNLATFNVRIQYLINKRRAYQANGLLRKMSAAGIQPDELTYNLLIKGFCMMGEIGMAKRIFFSIPGRGCELNSRIYQTIVHYLCKGGDFDLAYGLCKESMEKNWFPSTDTIHALLKGLMVNSKDHNARKIMKLVKARRPSYSTNDLRAFEDILSQGRRQK